MGSFADSSEYQVFNIMRQICDGVMPPIFGWVFPDKIVLYVNSVEFLEDIYTKQTPYMTKHWSDQVCFDLLVPKSIFFQATSHPDYAQKRKVVSSAFFK